MFPGKLPMNVDLSSQVAEKILLAEKLIEVTQNFKDIEGLQKLQRKIKQEQKFLQKNVKAGTIKKEHLQCSNLTHFMAVVNVLKNVQKCQSVNTVFKLDDRKIAVDIVCDDGLTWMKVVARNPKSLSQVCMGDASYGARSIIQQAEEFVQCAQLYPHLFQIPKVIFVFASGIGSNLASKIESFGIIIQGDRLYDIDNIEDFDDSYNDKEVITREVNTCDLSTQNVSHLEKVNLDVSAMLAYVSSVTNGSAALYDFPVHVLAQQAEWERQRPQKLILDTFFKDKKLFCCQTAHDDFVKIVHTVGGPNEQIRATEFLKRVTVLPDNATAEDDSSDEVFKNVQLASDKVLTVGGKIRQRSLIIFTFGDRIHAVTVTANDGFVRAAKQQGINFVVFIHESRALTEQKEQTKATKIQS